MSTVEKKRSLGGENGLEQYQSSPKKPKLFESGSESSNSSQGSGQLGSPSKFFSRQVLLLNSPEKSQQARKPKIEVDDLLLGVQNPLIAKKKALKLALDQLDNGEVDTHPLLMDILEKPIPETLTNLPMSTVLKARLNGKVREVKADEGYIKQQYELELFSGLAVIVDMIWSYFHLSKKTLVLKQALEQHLVDSHRKGITIAVVQASLKTLVELSSDWCQAQLIDSKEYFRIVKNVDIYLGTKKAILEKYNEMCAERDRQSLVTL